MTKNTLILCSSNSDAKWALKYIRAHSLDNIIIIAASPDAIAYFHTNNIPFFFLADYQHFEKPISILSKKVLLKSHSILRVIEKYAEKIDLKIGNINIISVLNDIITFQINDGLLMYETWQLIFKKHKPSTILVPQVSYKQHVNSSNNTYALAYYLQYYFTDDHNIITYKSTNKDTNIWFGLINNLLWQLKNIFIYIFYAITHNSKAINVNHAGSRRRIVMQTGGIITSYYYDLYHKLASKYDFHLITYKLLLPQINELCRHKVPYTPFETFYSRNTSSIIDKYSFFLNRKVNNRWDLEKELFQICKLDGILSSIVITETKKLLTSRLKNTILKIKTNETILQKFKPDLILNTHDPSLFGATFVLPAKNRSIKSLLLLHGIPLQEKPYAIYSDVIQIWGKKTRNYFNTLPKKRHLIIQTGFTKMDEYFPKSIYKNIEIIKKPVIIGFVLAVYHPFNSHLHKYFYEVFKELQQQFPQIILRFRFHEGFVSNNLYSLASAFYLQYIDCSNQSLDDFINDCDMFVVWDTSAILWCMISGKPIIHTAANWARPMLPTHEYRACWNPSSAKELVSLIKKIAENPAISHELIEGQKNLLEDYCGPLDSKASDRLERLIIKLAENQSPS